MSKRIYLYILLVATFFCSSCNFSASEEKFLNESELSFSISRNVLAQIDSSVETTVTIHTEVLKENTLIIDDLQDRKLLFNENNEPYLESITLNKVPLYCPLVFKMQVLIGDNLFAEGQSEEVVFSRKNKRLNLQLAVVLQDEPAPEEPKEPSEEEPKEPTEPEEPEAPEEPEEPEEPELELKINKPSITVEEWEETAIFTATEGFDSYNWTCGDQTGTTKEFVVDISKLNVKEYEVNLVAKKGETEYYATSKLTVNEISTPLVITEKDVVVEQGNNVTFVATKGFDSYSWSCSCGNSTSTEESFTINTKELSLGENSVRLKAKKGTKEYTTEAKFNVIPKKGDSNFGLIMETTEITVTEGENATFTALEGFDYYYWECGNQSKSGTNIFTVDTKELLSGKYIVKLIVTKGTNEYSAEAILVVEPKPGKVTGDITINQLEVKITAETNYETGELILTATEGFDNYIWEVMGEQSPITSNNSFTVNIRNLQLQGSYVIRVIATDKNGNEYSDEYIYWPAV